MPARTAIGNDALSLSMECFPVLCQTEDNICSLRMLNNSIPFSPECGPDFFAEFPAAPAVFLLRGADESAEPYVSKTANLRRRLQRLLGAPEGQSRRLNLRDRAAQIQYSLTGSDFESTLLLYRVFRQEFPQTYQKRLRLRPAPLIRFNLENAYPRAYVTTKIGRLTGQSSYYGPFRSRVAAEKFLSDSLDLFKIRRCTFELHPDPSFPGCVYSEMKMCLAPCFKGCTDQAYAAEVKRVKEYLDSCGESLLGEIAAERDRLSADLEFETAAQQHERMGKVKSILSGSDEICRSIDQLDAVIIQPSTQKDSVALFRFRSGQITGPEFLPIEAEPDGRSLDDRVRAALETLAPAGARTALQFTEELALLKRWYYRGHRVGEIVLAGRNGELSIRKLANATGRVHRGEKALEPAQGEQQVPSNPAS